MLKIKLSRSLFRVLSCLIALTIAMSLLMPAFAAKEYDNEFYVSPGASVNGDGSYLSPFNSINAAKEYLKANRDKLNGSTAVYISAGEWELESPLEFTSEDAQNVTYTVYNGKSAKLSGARKISGFTAEKANGVTVFTKEMPEGTAINALYRPDGDPLPVTRYPEKGFLRVKSVNTDDNLYVEGEKDHWEYTLGQQSFNADTDDITFDLSGSHGTRVRILHYWKDELRRVTKYDAATGRVSLSLMSTMLIHEDDRYFFENVYESLDKAAEWYFDNAASKLYYVPAQGETPDGLTLLAGNLEQLVTVDGANGIHFERLAFGSSGYELTDDANYSQAAVTVPGMIEVSHASGISFKNCEFINVGSSGVKFLNGAVSSSVTDCVFRNIGATGIFMGGKNGRKGDPENCADITAENNLIDGYGKNFYNAIGIQVQFCDGANIEHNTIRDGYYTGISCGWVWGYSYHLTNNIKIKDNLIHDVGQGMLSDMGGIYLLGIQNGTLLSGNVIYNITADLSNHSRGGWGIYFDEGSSQIVAEKNLVFCCTTEGFNVHYGEGNVIRNNISAFNGDGALCCGTRGQDDAHHSTSYIYNNIFLTDGGTPIYTHMHNTNHFYETSNLFWDISKGEKVRFCKDFLYDGYMDYRVARIRNFLHNDKIADPLFKDAANFDFTLSDNSPALELDFKPWDYTEAGVRSGSVIGIDTPAESFDISNAQRVEMHEAKYKFWVAVGNFFIILLSPILRISYTK